MVQEDETLQSFGVVVDGRLYTDDGFPHLGVTLHGIKYMPDMSHYMRGTCRGCGEYPVEVPRADFPANKVSCFWPAKDKLREQRCPRCQQVLSGRIEWLEERISLRETLPYAFRYWDKINGGEQRAKLDEYNDLQHEYFLPNTEGLWIPAWWQTPEGLMEIAMVCNIYGLVARPFGSAIGIKAVAIPSEREIADCRKELDKLSTHAELMEAYQPPPEDAAPPE